MDSLADSMAHGDSMNLPTGVEKQGQLADALIAENAARKAAMNGAGGEPQPNPGPNNGAANNPTNPPQNNANDENSPEYWRNRFMVLDGKYRAEVPRLAADKRALAEENASLKTRVKSLEEAAAKNNAPPNTAASAQPATGDAVAKLKEKYGDEFVTDFLAAFPNANTAPAAPAKTEAEIAELRAAEARRARNEFFAYLDANAAGWREKNEDPHFIGWLSQEDEFSGRVRQDLFDEAVGKNDGVRTAKFFNSFGSQSGAASPNPDGGQGASNNPPKNEGNDQPGVIISPPADGGSNPPAPPQPKIWTGPEIAKFYEDCRRNKYTPEEVARIENDIAAANKEGRIR